MIILDTNVVSALMQPELNPAIVDWLDRQSGQNVMITAITLLESRSGIFVLPQGKKRTFLGEGLDRLLKGIFAGRILPFDERAAEEAARIFATRVSKGINIDLADTQIAAIAVVQDATIATRNIRHFSDLGLDLINPWHG